jgi:SnoaL-like polyketide cyclase
MLGTHDGDFLGAAPSGMQIAAQAMNSSRLANGQIVEERGQPDLLMVLQQIGTVPRRVGELRLRSKGRVCAPNREDC